MAVNNIGGQLLPLIGRAQELADIHHQLSDPDCRLLTLVGPGGIGKTRLALEIARQYSLPNGVYFVPLQPLTSPEFIVSAIADALDFQFYGAGDPKQQLVTHLREKSLLLILDNFEHLIDGAPLLSDIHAAAPAVRMLVTSRERLNLREEWVYEVTGLAFPNATEREIEAYDAVRLFMQKARRANANFALIGDKMSDVARICRMVGGMPLGIELAAAWVRALSCKAIADEIEQGLDILETQARNIEPRHRTMRAALEPTWARLSDEERKVFMQLSVFRGGFTREAGESVAGASRRILASLVDKSLVQLDANGRYSLHELLRQYAEEQLNSAQESEQTQAAHAAYFAAFMSQREQDLFGNNQKAGLEKIDSDIDNIRSAFRHAVENGKFRDIIQIADSLGFFYDLRGWYHESEQTFRQAAERLQLGSHDLQEEHNRSLGFCLAIHGLNLLTRLHQPNLARNVIHTSLTLLRPLPIGKELHRALHALAEFPSDYAERTRWAQEALRVAGELEFHWGIAMSLDLLSEVAEEQGRYAEAKQRGFEALTIFRQLENHHGINSLLRRLSKIALIEKNFAEARRMAQEARTTAEAINFPRGVITASNLLGSVAHTEGSFTEAKQHFRESIAVAKAINDTIAICTSLARLARSAIASGDLSEAWDSLRQALIIVLEIQSTLRLYVLSVTAEYLMRVGNKEFAAEICTFLVGHPGSHAETRDEAQNLLNELKSSAGEFNVRRSERTLDDIISELLQLPAVSDNVTTYPNRESRSSPLSDRELEILHFIADGLSNREIADQLVVALSTVKWHINQIYSKLGVDSRTRAAARARELNILD